MHRTTYKLKKNHLLLALLLAFTLSACEQPDREYHYSIFTFGTLIDVTLYSNDKENAEAAFHQLQKDFDFFHQNWSPWTNGDLAKINKQIANGDSDIEIPNHLLPILKKSILLSRKSNNYFNPAIGNLINLWQFHKHEDADIRPPDVSLIQALLKTNPRMSNLSFNSENQLTSTNTAVALNFGAFAKGYAIAQAISRLQKFGIHNAVINAGGDLSVIGLHDKRAWNVGIRHPRSNDILASITVSNNESVFTSGDYERSYNYKGQRYHHILDPETGYPTTDAQSVTVLHTDAGLADASATAIFVAGSRHWQETAKEMGIKNVMLIDRSGNIHLTASMKKRIKFLNKAPTSHIFVSEEL